MKSPSCGCGYMIKGCAEKDGLKHLGLIRNLEHRKGSLQKGNPTSLRITTKYDAMSPVAAN